jgi:hypothetical protein
MDEVIPLRRTDGWVETEATIISCKQTVFSSLQSSAVSSDGYYELLDYTVTFRYSVAHKSFKGKYKAYSEQAIGSTLTIAYDPLRPHKNTGADLVLTPWIRIVAWTIGAGFAALAIWLESRMNIASF